MSIYPDLTYLHALGDGGPRSRTQVVVIHATDNSASADAEASYATHRLDKTSAHFYVDDRAAVQGLNTSHIAYGCLYHGNQISVQFELCGLSNHLTDATMRRAAPVVARVCAEFGIPVRKVSAADVANGVTGICGHADITAAFPQDHGDHTDPGASFPWSTFISYVQGGGGMDLNDTDAFFGNAKENLFSTYRIVGHALLSGEDPVGNLFWLGKAGSSPNVLHQKLDRILAAASASAPVTLSAEDLDALAQKVAALLAPLLVQPAAQVADELAKRLGNG